MIAQKKETLSLLKKITKRVEGGEGFDVLASIFSMDPGSKNKGGGSWLGKKGFFTKKL